MVFWGISVERGRPVTVSFRNAPLKRLRVSRATMRGRLDLASDSTKLLCRVGDRQHIALCSFSKEQGETCGLDLEFEGPDDVVFSVSGAQNVDVTGYYFEDARPINITISQALARDDELGTEIAKISDKLSLGSRSKDNELPCLSARALELDRNKEGGPANVDGAVVGEDEILQHREVTQVKLFNTDCTAPIKEIVSAVEDSSTVKTHKAHEDSSTVKDCKDRDFSTVNASKGCEDDHISDKGMVDVVRGLSKDAELVKADVLTKEATVISLQPLMSEEIQQPLISPEKQLESEDQEAPTPSNAGKGKMGDVIHHVSSDDTKLVECDEQEENPGRSHEVHRSGDKEIREQVTFSNNSDCREIGEGNLHAGDNAANGGGEQAPNSPVEGSVQQSCKERMHSGSKQKRMKKAVEGSKDTQDSKCVMNESQLHVKGKLKHGKKKKKAEEKLVGADATMKCKIADCAVDMPSSVKHNTSQLEEVVEPEKHVDGDNSVEPNNTSLHLVEKILEPKKKTKTKVKLTFSDSEKVTHEDQVVMSGASQPSEIVQQEYLVDGEAPNCMKNDSQPLKLEKVKHGKKRKHAEEIVVAADEATAKVESAVDLSCNPEPGQLRKIIHPETCVDGDNSVEPNNISVVVEDQMLKPKTKKKRTKEIPMTIAKGKVNQKDRVVSSTLGDGMERRCDQDSSVAFNQQSEIVKQAVLVEGERPGCTVSCEAQILNEEKLRQRKKKKKTEELLQPSDEAIKQCHEVSSTLVLPNYTQHNPEFNQLKGSQPKESFLSDTRSDRSKKKRHLRHDKHALDEGDCDEKVRSVLAALSAEDAPMGTDEHAHLAKDEPLPSGTELRRSKRRIDVTLPFAHGDRTTVLGATSSKEVNPVKSQDTDNIERSCDVYSIKQQDNVIGGENNTRMMIICGLSAHLSPAHKVPIPRPKRS